MSLRCPSSEFLGIGRLKGYHWIINDRGYANIVETKQSDDEVYGLIYSLSHSDEVALDRNEGVPIAYTKETISVQFRASDQKDNIFRESREMLVYIDRKRIEPDSPKQEYIYRMNMGINDGLVEGIPQAYFDKNLRRFIPAKVDQGVEILARQKALKFEDET